MVAAIVLVVLVGYLEWVETIIFWALVAAALGVVLVNVRWRSLRVSLIYSLCLACRARRGRWIIYWFVAFLVATGLAFFVSPAMLLLLLPMYVLAERLQPAALRPAKVTKEQIWLRGVGPRVREQFPPLEDPLKERQTSPSQ